MEAMDQPSIDGLNTWFVSKAAAEQGVKVMISGLGGDELLGGYPSFEVVPRWAKWLKWPGRVPGLGRGGRWLGSRLPTAVGSPKAAGMLEYGLALFLVLASLLTAGRLARKGRTAERWNRLAHSAPRSLTVVFLIAFCLQLFAAGAGGGRHAK